MRTVALFASQRSSDEFNKAWPHAAGSEPDKKTWGTKEDAAELRKQIDNKDRSKHFFMIVNILIFIRYTSTRMERF